MNSDFLTLLSLTLSMIDSDGRFTHPQTGEVFQFPISHGLIEICPPLVAEILEVEPELVFEGLKALDFAEATGEEITQIQRHELEQALKL